MSKSKILLLPSQIAASNFCDRYCRMSSLIVRADHFFSVVECITVMRFDNVLVEVMTMLAYHHLLSQILSLSDLLSMRITNDHELSFLL